MSLWIQLFRTTQSLHQPPEFPPLISFRSAVKWSVSRALSSGVAPRMRLSVTVNREPVAFSMPLLILDRVIVTPLVAMTSRPVIDLASITVLGVVIRNEPLYAVRAVPAGTPALPGPGKQPPHGSGPPATFRWATGQVEGVEPPPTGGATASPSE